VCPASEDRSHRFHRKFGGASDSLGLNFRSHLLICKALVASAEARTRRWLEAHKRTASVERDLAGVAAAAGARQVRSVRHHAEVFPKLRACVPVPGSPGGVVTPICPPWLERSAVPCGRVRTGSMITLRTVPSPQGQVRNKAGARGQVREKCANLMPDERVAFGVSLGATLVG
jgi:hypothetical protein